MGLFHSNLYKKYYPLRSFSTFCEMDDKELKLLTKWIKNTERDAKRFNFKKGKVSPKDIEGFLSLIEGSFRKSADKLCEALKNKQLQDLDKNDLSFVNFVLQRHKYNSIISFLSFRYTA